MARRYVGALDQGTTSTRFIIFDKAGSPVATAQREHAQHFPAAALVEHDVEEIWERVQQVIGEALTAADLGPSDLAAIGITNQRETVVVWNKLTGRAYYNALVWQDQRGAPACAALAARLGGVDALASRTGLPIVPYFSASKLSWLLKNAPGARAAVDAGEALAGTIDSFLVWRLTAGAQHVTDVSNASRTMLVDLKSPSVWDPYLTGLWDIPPSCLPAIAPSSHVYGYCAPDSVLPGVPIAGILGDQQAALFGQACFSPGDAKNTYGTGCFCLMNTGNVPVHSSHGLITTVAYQIGNAPPVYALEGSVAVAGAVVTWLRDALGVIASSSDCEALAGSVPDAGGLVFVPAFNGLFAPHWRSDARGILAGLSGSTTAAHITRAALEAIAHQSRELLQAMEADGAAAGLGAAGSKPDLRVDGGATANGLLMQFQADVLGHRVVRPVVAETTALGAAYAAGLAVKFWASTEELAVQWAVGATWCPSMPSAAVEASVRDWDRAVSRTLGWADASRDAHNKTAAAEEKKAATPASAPALAVAARLARPDGPTAVVAVLAIGLGFALGLRLGQFVPRHG